MVKRLIKFYTLQSKSDRSELCENQTKLLYDGVYNSELWAERIIDASAKLPTGITKLHVSDVGYFDECINVINESLSIKGKYCLTTVKTPEKNYENQTLIKNEMSPYSLVNLVNLDWAICVPDGCTAKDVENHLNTFAGIDIYNLDESRCQTIDTYKSKLNAGDWVVIVSLIILCIIILLSTIYDVILYYKKGEIHHPVLIAFSWFTNFKKLTKISNNADMLPCLNGIRFISMLWIIYGHEYEHIVSILAVNIIDLYNWQSKFSSMLILGASVSVDSFFLLSGCLLMCGFLKMKAKGMPFNIPFYYLHRYIRLTPSYAAAIVFSLTLYRFMGSGPLWDPENTNEQCKKYWWAALLYIQNYFPGALDPCIAVSWYLQIDMQLYILAPLILVPIAKWPKIATYILSSLLLVSVIIPTTIAWHYGFTALEKIQPGGHTDPAFGQIYYNQTYTRAGPWILGLLLGHILFNTKNKKIVINKVLATLLWIISISTMFYIVFGLYIETKPDYEYDRVFNSLFIGLSRVVWSAGLSWIIFCCVKGYGGPINWFLSLPIFQVLARLTYSMYLIHFILQNIRQKSLQMPFIFSNTHVVRMTHKELNDT